MAKRELVTPDPWDQLCRATPARIALGRAGGSVPTRAWLEFKSAHAAAREAVHCPFDTDAIAAEIKALGVDVTVANSAASNLATFLQRPDLGRRLDDSSRLALEKLHRSSGAPQLAIIVSNGLSALAVHRQVPGLLAELLPLLTADGYSFEPIIVTRFARVALQDEIGNAVGAQLALMLIGERPGLVSPDSLGAYLVYAPRTGNNDSNRNCVSNIRDGGLSWHSAASTIHYLLTQATRRRESGVGLKDERESCDLRRVT